ncbi:deoxyribose-phosphate aldolase [Legionella antarctica]|uniref:deoxyribose-phosphate aldolase n=1 Tax=Legionella antarctica TaxID=2708020 RepID=A0A6F8T5T9_9GAMM|nr:deoxyribose-phosphate aldolase [Legionella antarctica]BCA95573.1 deoxyribose-phosphate aldolase [Legionella antarctica]
MTLEAHLNSVLEHLIADAVSSGISIDQLIQSMDLTLLKDNPSDEELENINQLAKNHPVASLCVYANHLYKFNLPSGFNFATVVNFPHGNNDLNSCIKEIDQSLILGVKEIDYVFPYQMYLADNKHEALNQCRAIAQSCKQYGLTLKIIMETGAFSDIGSIYQLSVKLIDMGCAFLKTSTGKIAQGASLSAVFAILSAIKDSEKKCGVKISGGIKTPKQAREYAYLAELVLNKKINKDWFRLGASSLLDEFLKSR